MIREIPAHLLRSEQEPRCGVAGDIDRMSVMDPKERWLDASEKPRILHVSADFPDCFDAFKTSVVRTLVDLTGGEFRHQVISLNRMSPQVASFGMSIITGLGAPRISISAQPFQYGRSLVYEAPGRGLFHATMLRQLGDWIADELSGAPLPDLMIGHKLTIEGIAVRRAAARLGIPFGICIQGDTDCKVLAARFDLGKEFGDVFRDAAVLFPFTPWALEQFEKRFGKRSRPTMMLPCPTDLDEPMPPRFDGNGLVTVFHLKNHRRKNLHGALAALKCLRDEGSDLRLEIIGGGAPSDLSECQAMAKGIANLAFEGPLGRLELRHRLNRATGFVMPSLRESFGLVFLEALFAGAPIIYPKGTAIDGYFDGRSFAIGVDARNPDEIAAAMRTLVLRESELKRELAVWQQSDHAQQFRRSAIRETFARGLKGSLKLFEVAR